MDVPAWIGNMQSDDLSPSRVRQAHVLLSSLLDAAVRDGRIGRNVAHGARLPRLERREAAFFEPNVIDELLAKASDQHRAFLALQGLVGLRFGEAAAARRGAVNLLRRRLRVEESLAEIGGALIFGTPKSHAVRSVPLSPALVTLIARHMEDVAPTSDALPLT